MESLTTQQSQVKTYLEPHKLVLAGQIGEGLSAKVYRAIDGNGFTYDVKVFRPSAYAKSGGQLIQREIDAASDLKHVSLQRAVLLLPSGSLCRTTSCQLSCKGTSKVLRVLLW